MRHITRLLPAVAVVLAAGCSTTIDRVGHLNPIPRWYWDEAWVGEVGHDSSTPALVDEITTWAFTFLFHESGFDESVLPGPKYVGVREYLAGAELTDPSPAVLAALRAAGYDVKPCSSLRFPSEDEQEPNNPGCYRGIEDPDTGKRVYVYYVTVKRVISPTLGRITVGRDSGPLAGGGSEFIIGKRGGVWKVFLKLGSWTS